MSLKFNIDRPRVSDEEIKRNQNFNALVEQFKKQSLKKAQGDESWRKNKLIRYSTVIAGITVVCTVTYLSLNNYQKTKKTTNDKITTSEVQHKKENKNADNTVFASRKFSSAPEAAGHLKQQYSRYSVNNQRGGEIRHHTGTTIRVPRNSFVNSAGTQIRGEVSISYREFHDIGDVIVNGIPMGHDTSGRTTHLETAGMFDLRGTQNGEPVFIAPASQLTVELASKSESRFNQYRLDTVSGNWKYLGKDVIAPVVSKHEVRNSKENLLTLKNEIDKVIPAKIDSVSSVYHHNIQKMPAVREPYKPAKPAKGRPSFRLDGSYDEFPELTAFSDVVFEVGPENKNYSKELHEITWSDVSISPGPEKGRNYFLDMKFRNRHERLIVYPVLTGRDFEKASAEYEKRFNEYKIRLEKKNAEERRLLAELEKKQSEYLAEQKKKQAEYDARRAEMMNANTVANQELAASFTGMDDRTKVRSIFKVSSFGIYNSDCPHPEPSGQNLTPKFVSGSDRKPLPAQDVMLIDHESKLVFWLDRQQHFTMRFETGSRYSLCLFTKAGIFICDSSQFLADVENGSGVFIFKDVTNRASNLSEFKKTLEI